MIDATVRDPADTAVGRAHVAVVAGLGCSAFALALDAGIAQRAGVAVVAFEAVRAGRKLVRTYIRIADRTPVSGGFLPGFKATKVYETPSGRVAVLALAAVAELRGAWDAVTAGLPGRRVVVFADETVLTRASDVGRILARELPLLAGSAAADMLLALDRGRAPVPRVGHAVLVFRAGLGQRPTARVLRRLRVRGRLTRLRGGVDIRLVAGVARIRPSDGDEHRICRVFRPAAHGGRDEHEQDAAETNERQGRHVLIDLHFSSPTIFWPSSARPVVWIL